MKKPYLPALDGLRAFAVLAVIIYHINPSLLPGGFLGVTIFFVLSGYLITDLLLHEFIMTGSIRLDHFWLRRARRLLPALYTVLAVVSLYVVFTMPKNFLFLRGDLFAALLYVSNWWLLFHHISYFASYQVAQPFLHLWSLAVEEQFYLLWPLLLLFLFHWAKNKTTFYIVFIALAVLSVMLMGILAGPDPSRVYYGTDTRAFSLIIGAILALRFPSYHKHSLPLPRYLITIFGVITFMFLLVTMIVCDQYQAFLYPYGMLLVSLATAVMILLLMRTKSGIARFFAKQPLRYLGKRSYSLYLWHYPIIVLTTPMNATQTPSIIRPLFQIILSIVMAELTYRFIEEPIHHGITKKWSYNIMAILPLSAIVGLSFYVLQSIPQKQAQAMVIPSIAVALPSFQTDSQPVTKEKTMKKNHQPLHGNMVTTIGDSIMLDLKPDLLKYLPGIIVDGKVSRQMYQLQDTLNTLQKAHHLHKILVIELGTNGPFDPTIVEQQLNALHEKGILIINTRVPRPWQNDVNARLVDVVKHVAHAHLLNWYAISSNHDAYFFPDGVHLDSLGARVLSAWILHDLMKFQLS